MLNPFASIKTAAITIALTFLVSVALVQTARIEGALFWKGLKAENTELRETLSKVEQAQELAAKLAKEEKARIEAENKRKAEHAKLDYQKRLAANDAALRNWLQNNRRATGKANMSSAGQATSGVADPGAATDIPATHAIVPIADLELSAQAFAKLEALQAFWRGVHNKSHQD